MRLANRHSLLPIVIAMRGVSRGEPGEKFEVWKKGFPNWRLGIAQGLVLKHSTSRLRWKMVPAGSLVCGDGAGEEIGVPITPWEL
jgi:hypothetical protein